ncbi:MAG: ATP-binding protein [bacterium]
MINKQPARHRPDLLLRLGYIIVIQVVFAFAALALFINNYAEDSVQGSYDEAGQKLHSLALELARSARADQLTEQSQVSGSEVSASIDSLLASREALDAASVFVAAEGESPQALMWWSRTQVNDPAGVLPVRDLIDAGTLRFALQQPSGSTIPHSLNQGRVIYYYPFEISSEQPAVLVAVTDDDFLVSSRAQVMYGLFVLFLCSFLVSLLTVYLVYRHVRDPLRRLRQGLQKTTEGDLYYQIEPTGQDDVTDIAQSFNQISRRLWDNHTKLKQYNSLIQEAYLSNLESQAFLATLIDCSPCCIVATTPKGEIMIFNRMAGKAFGYDDDPPLGSNVNELFMQAVVSATTPVMVNEEQTGHEVVCKRKDGGQFSAYLVVSPIINGEAQVSAMLYILLDISESKNFQEMMVRVDRHRTRGEMAGDIAHEINNYLAVLSGNIELMPLFLKRGDTEKIASKLDLMKKTVDRISHFTDGLMDVNHGEAKFEHVDINQLIQNLLTFLKPQNRFDAIDFVTELGSDLPLCEADMGQVQQLLVNFIHNAGDALAEQPIRRIRIISRLQNQAGWRTVRIEVRDSGPGVPEDKRETLFKGRFTTKRKGHGYGLVTCRKIVDTHSGRIGYEHDGESVFYIELPLERQQPGGVDTTKAISATAAAPV